MSRHDQLAFIFSISELSRPGPGWHWHVHSETDTYEFSVTPEKCNWKNGRGGGEQTRRVFKLSILFREQWPSDFMHCESLKLDILLGMGVKLERELSSLFLWARSSWPEAGNWPHILKDHGRQRRASLLFLKPPLPSTVPKTLENEWKEEAWNFLWNVPSHLRPWEVKSEGLGIQDHP